MTIDNISENGKGISQPQTIFDLVTAPIDGKPREQHAAEMKRWLEALLDKDQAVELRALKVADDRFRVTSQSGFFDSDHIDTMVQWALRLTGGAEGVYFTLNPINPDLLARRCNRVDVATGGDLTCDAGVVSRRWLLIDADPARISGVSSTDAEKCLAWAVVQRVQTELTKAGWPAPVVADSGNGYHLLYRIELESDDGGLVKRVLMALASQFTTPQVKIDEKVFNPARIVKFYGTLARKGDHTDERPHRRSKIITMPDELQVVPLGLLEAMAARAPQQPGNAVGSQARACRQGYHVGLADSKRRATAYLDKTPGAISGENGSGATFAVACSLVLGFDLSVEEALPIMQVWNEKCQPPWEEKDLLHKLNDAHKKNEERGYLLRNGAGRALLPVKGLLRAGDAGNGTPSPAETKTAEATEKDLLAMLGTVEQGWTPSKVEEFVCRYTDVLGLGAAALGPAAVADLLGRLQKALKNSKYTPPSKKALLEMVASQGGKEAGGTTSAKNPQFALVDGTTEGASTDPAAWGIVDLETGEQLTNFGIVYDRQISIEDEFECRHIFQGQLTIFGKARPFEVTSGQLASDKELREAIYNAAGPEAQLPKDMVQLRNAIAAISRGKVVDERRSTNQGWNEDGTVYRVQSGEITRNGFAKHEGSGLVVDLKDEEQAKHLDLQPAMDLDELNRLRRHIVDDLLAVHDPSVTHALLGGVGAALLHRFAGDANRFAMWLTGMTGSGKSFLGQLFMNFFGRFRPSSGSFVTWGSTGNYVQREGYFFKDAMYLVDDYKPDVTYRNQVIRILQNYADNTGRGRLKADATTNTTRPIRGLLLSTGEDIPEHSASALARSIIVEVPALPKDLERGQRCLEASKAYTAVTVDFLRWFLAKKREKRFQRWFRKLQRDFYRGIAGQQNDIRIASNLALLGCGFIEMARYLRDVWPGWSTECLRYLKEELIQVRQRMVEQAHDQQPSEVFFSTLKELVQYGSVQIEGYGTTAQAGMASNGRIIGKVDGCPVGSRILKISLPLALGEVQESLRRQGRPPLAVTNDALEKQLLADGKLLGADGKPLSTDSSASKMHQRLRVDGTRQRCIRLREDMLKEHVSQPRPRPDLKLHLGTPDEEN